MSHAVVHFEIDGADEGSLVAFYEAVFDWTLQGAGGGRTAIDTRAGGINGGIGKSPTGEAMMNVPSVWLMSTSMIA